MTHEPINTQPADAVIDYAQTQTFWESRAAQYGATQAVLAATLQDDLPAIARYRDRAEKQHVFSRVRLSAQMRVLDLGGGAGRWALAIAPRVKEVTLVDFSRGMLSLAQTLAEKRGITNIRFVQAAVQTYCDAGSYDVIVISGVLMYINDADLPAIAQHCREMLAPGGRLVVREGVNVSGRVARIQEYTPELRSVYSVIWRQPADYLALFGAQLAPEYSNDAFPFLVPVFLFKRLVPARFHQNQQAQAILYALLRLQNLGDGMLLRCRFLLDAYHQWMQRQPLAVHAHLAIFRRAPTPDNGYCFAGTPLRDMIRETPTPFFLFSEAVIKKNHRDFLEGFPEDNQPRIYYSIKTNYESGVLRTLRQLGLGAEISTELDWYLADKAGFQPPDIVLDGAIKSDQLLRRAISARVALINVESWEEISRISSIARSLGADIRLGLRLRTPRRVRDLRNFFTDRRQKHFGLLPAALTERISRRPLPDNVTLVSLMMHTDKSFTVPADYGDMLAVLFPLAAQLRRHGITIETFNLGGGIPEPGMSAQPLAAFGQHISRWYQKLAQRHRLRPRLIFELGKSLVGNAGIIVGTVARIDGTQVTVDISRSDVGFVFPFRQRAVVVANKSGWPRTRRMKLCSANLEKFDILAASVALPDVSPGDTIILHNVGAYSLPLSTQFTRPRSAVYYISEAGAVNLIRRAETLAEVTTCQLWT